MSEQITKQEPGGLSLFTLKILTMITMVIDHVGVVFFPGNFEFRIIGRLAFPIFCYLIVNGLLHTHSKLQYLARLLIFALLSQIPYMLLARKNMGLSPLITPTGETIFSSPQLFFSSVTEQLNSLFILFLGLLAITILQLLQQKLRFRGGEIVGTLLGLVIAAGLCWVSFLIHCEYAALGIPLIVGFYMAAWLQSKPLNNTFRNFVRFVLPACAILSYMISNCVQASNPNALNHQLLAGCVQLLSLLFVFLYKGKRGYHNRVVKYFFYWFYPAHIAILMACYLAVSTG